MQHIQINTCFGGWHTVDADMARRFVSRHLDGMKAIPSAQRAAYIEEHYLRGITVQQLMQGDSE